MADPTINTQLTATNTKLETLDGHIDDIKTDLDAIAEALPED